MAVTKNYKILFEWSKGAPTKRKVFILIVKENKNGNAVYVTRLTNLYNSSHSINERGITISSIRKCVNALKNYGLIKAVNEGGKPEYLEPTETGLKIFDKLELKDKDFHLDK